MSTRTANHVRLSIEQGTAVTHPDASNTVTVTFAKAFRSAPNVVVMDIGDDNANVGVMEVSASSVKIFSSIENVTVMWRAIGER